MTLVPRMFHETPEEARAHYREYLKGKVIGRPKATETFTVEQLEAMGMVGLYVEGEE